ncbi:MAG: hypothetical protein ACRD0U_05980 [Acidimicrobiales bacterium]
MLVDHTFGGIAKDAAVLGPLADVVARWRGASEVELVEEPVDIAAGRVIEAVESTRVTVDPPVTDDYRVTEALLRARLGRLAVDRRDDEPLDLDVRGMLVAAFLDDPAGAA